LRTSAYSPATFPSAQIRAGASSPEWFQKNYGIAVLDAAKGAERLRSTHKKTFHEEFQVKDTLDFTAEELITLESALETMTDGVVAGFKDLQMVRQKREIEAVKKGKKWVPKPHKKGDPEDAGLSIQAGTDRTVIIFDTVHLNDAALFMGGKKGSEPAHAEPAAAGTITHELGHIVSWGPGVKEAFDKLVKKKKIETFTWYAASQPAQDFFAESFMLYQLDPEWLEAHSHDIFEFFDVLTKTGSPPTPKTAP
jgi:hypothetical protein